MTKDDAAAIGWALCHAAKLLQAIAAPPKPD